MKSLALSMLTVSVVAAVATTGCSAPEDSASSSLEVSQPQLEVSQTKIELQGLTDVVALDDNTLLASSNTQGLNIIQHHSDMSNIAPGQFDNIVRVGEYFASININADRVDVYAVDPTSASITTVLSVNKFGYGFDSVCSYNSDLDSSSYLYTTDGDGVVIQWLIAKDGTMLSEAIEVRSFFVGPDVNNCAADDHSGTIYFAEPAAGIWRYKAEPEAKLERELIAAVQPFGVLPEGLADLNWVDPDQSYMVGVIDETNEVLVIDTAADSEEAVQSLMPLGENAEIERISMNGMTATVLDGGHGVVGQFQLDLPAAPLSVTSKSSLRQFNVTPVAETTPMLTGGDAADDPVIWVNEADTSQSLILGTNKKSGLRVYRLDGTLVSSIDNGHINNVDIVAGGEFNGRRLDVATASNRTHNSISVYTIDPTTSEVMLDHEHQVELPDVYGLCMADYGDSGAVWLNSKNGTFVEYVFAKQAENITLMKSREFTLPSQPEGCTFHAPSQTLFAGEENSAVWSVDLSQAELAPKKIISVDGVNIVDDIEGIDIAYGQGGEADLLVISSQGDNSYVLAEVAPPHSLVAKFQITANTDSRIDGVSETDGLAVSTIALGDDLPMGALVVQDGFNVMPTDSQNFKVISWAEIRSQLSE